MRSNVARRSKTFGCIDSCNKGHRYDYADARCGHQSSCLDILARHGPEATLQGRELRGKHIPCFQKRRGDHLERRVTFDQLAHPGSKGSERGPTNFEPEAAQDAAQAEIYVVQLHLQDFASRQNGTNLLRR